MCLYTNNFLFIYKQPQKVSFSSYNCYSNAIHPIPTKRYYSTSCLPNNSLPSCLVRYVENKQHILSENKEFSGV